MTISIKRVPAPIDIVTSFVISPRFIPYLELACRTYFGAYNEAVRDWNKCTLKLKRIPRRFLRDELYLDQNRRKGWVSSPANRAIIDYTRLQDAIGFDAKQALTNFKRTTACEETNAEGYANELILFIDNLVEKRTEFMDFEKYMRVAFAACVKRAFVMAGFFASNALQDGLTPETLEDIIKTIDAGVATVPALISFPELASKEKEILATKEVLVSLRSQFVALRK